MGDNGIGKRTPVGLELICSKTVVVLRSKRCRSGHNEAKIELLVSG